MPTFYINDTNQTSQSIGSGEGGIIGPDGAILVLANGVTMSGTADLIVMGNITTFNKTIVGSSVTESEIVIGSSGSIASSKLTIDITFSEEAFFVNNGNLSGVSGALHLNTASSAPLGTQITAVNTGVISSADDTIELSVKTNGQIAFNNSGTIASGNGVFDLSGSGDALHTIVNTGLISSGDLTGAGSAYYGAEGTDHILNSGQIVGNIELGDGDDVYEGTGGSLRGSVSGGDGDDAYIVDQSDILILELSGEGTDLVQASVGFKLPEFVENLNLLGAQDLRAVGNSLANDIVGNAGSNKIAAGSGDDTVQGDAGNDLIFGGGGADSILAGDGDDDVASGSGNDTMFGNDGDDTLSGKRGEDSMNGGEGDDLLLGGLGDDILKGSVGDDTLNGGEGADTLEGGSGLDVFVYTAMADSPNSGGGRDTVTDFVAGTDQLDISALVFGDFDINIGGSLTGGGTASLRTYETAGGDTRVFVDIDGDGAQDMRIDLIGTVDVTGADFLI